MKISTYTVWDKDGNIIEEESYEYEGPLALCSSDDDDDDEEEQQVQGPTAEERALWEQQAEALRSQKDFNEETVRMQKLMFPMQMKSAGMNAIFNKEDPETGELTDPSLKKGAVIGFEKADDINTQMREGIETQYLTRVQAALAGELPEDPALIAQLGEQEDALHESLRQQLGPGWQTSSPGIEAISKFEEGKFKLLDAARRGDLTLAEQLGQSRENVNLNRAQMGYAGALAGSQYGAQAAGRLAGGYGAAGGAQGQLRLGSEQLRFGDMASRRAASAQKSAGMWGGIGNVVGMTSYPWMQKWAT